MKQIERLQLINSIALKLQEEMNTSSINSFLSGFKIQCENVNIVPSKRVYVVGLLASQPDTLIKEIGSQLN